MGRYTLRFAALMLVYAGQVSAQREVAQRELTPAPRPVSTAIQVLLPGGAKPGSKLTVLLHTDDGRYNETLFTTRDGWVVPRALEEDTPVVLTVAGEEGIFQTTSMRFAAFEGQMTMHLRAWPGAKGTVSAASLYQPDGKARKLCDKAAKDLKNSRFEEAEKKLREAAAIDARYTRPLIVLGRLRLHQERYDEAAEWFEKALAVDRESALALAGLGIAHLGRGQNEQAVALLERAAKISPVADVEYHLGIALLEGGRWSEAEGVLKRVAAQESAHTAVAHFALGRLYLRRGERSQGLVSFESFLRRKPEGPEAALAREMIRELRSAGGHPR